MGVDLEKKRKLLLYPIEYQRGCPCEWVLGFARAAETAGRLKYEARTVNGDGAGSNMGLRDGQRAHVLREAPNQLCPYASGFGICKDCGDAGRLKYGPGGQG